MPSEEQLKDIRWAIDGLAARQIRYLKYQNYYEGEHALMIDQKRLQTIFGRLFEKFRLNLCSAVVDALSDRLEVSGFSVQGDDVEDELDDLTPPDELEESVQSADDAISQDAEDIWSRNRMDRQSREVHSAAISAGDSFVIVWPDSEQDPIIYPQASHEVIVAYAGENPGKIVRAAKLWQIEVGKEAEAADGQSTSQTRRVYHRLNLYYPDRIEKYVTEPTSAGIGRTVTAGAFSEHEVPGETWPLVNQYGKVPVFHFANGAALGKLGVSELRDAVPVQDWMNYTVFSLLTGQEYQSFPQRYAIGVEVPKDENDRPVNPFKAGPDRMWIANPEDPEKPPSMGQFEAADLSKLIEVKQEISLSMAQVTQTPSHHFMLAPGLVSGESQKTAEGKLDSKVKDRKGGFGDTWAAVMTLALQMKRGVQVDGLELECEWADTKPRNELESWQIADLKSSLGVSRKQILREMGYTDRQIRQFEKEGGGLGQAPSVSVTQGLGALVPNGALTLEPGAPANEIDEER